ncbi:hypothetical protein PMZ80_006399 [Knufia obscura]|uniref:Uncharacterized protein n=2 Tax=Knufia TaxID=430999 RepID=A0AAN8EE24_9EURO|nr:hypothetical protein PMZ80_006399 [Knufia obscura]KAK5953454.1 hypothetical protein OHC33_005398 [Knufia fluminis]
MSIEIPCTDQSMSRGPAKGYIEGLEHRLHEAESLLLQLLPHVPTEQLHAATSALANNEIEDAGRASPDHRSSPPILNKKTGIDYWEIFPLTSVDSIRRWQQDCEAQSTTNNTTQIKTEHRRSSPGTRMLSEDASASRKKRQSINEHKTSVSHTGDLSTLNDLFTMQNGQSSSVQVIQAQNEHIRVALDQQRRQNSWQAQMMQSTTNHAGQNSGLRQQQIFGQSEYFGNSNPNTWHTQQTDMNMDILGQESAQQDAIPAVTTQTHSHLFW